MNELVLDVFLQHVDKGLQRTMEGNKSGVTRFALRVLYTSIVGKSVVAGGVASEMQVDSGMAGLDTNSRNIVHTASDEAARADTEDEDASCGCSNLGSDTEHHCSLQAFLDDVLFNLETETYRSCTCLCIS